MTEKNQQYEQNTNNPPSLQERAELSKDVKDKLSKFERYLKNCLTDNSIELGSLNPGIKEDEETIRRTFRYIRESVIKNGGFSNMPFLKAIIDEYKNNEVILQLIFEQLWEQVYEKGNDKFSITNLVPSEDLEILLSEIQQEVALYYTIGAGEGRNTSIAKKKATQVMISDLSEAAISSAKQKFGNLQGVSFNSHPAYEINPTLQGRIDIVEAWRVLHSLTPEYIDLTMKNVRNVLSENSKFILSVGSINDPQSSDASPIEIHGMKLIGHEEGLPRFKKFFTKIEIEELAEKHDFQITEIKEVEENSFVKGNPPRIYWSIVMIKKKEPLVK